MRASSWAISLALHGLLLVPGYWIGSLRVQAIAESTGREFSVDFKRPNPAAPTASVPASLTIDTVADSEPAVVRAETTAVENTGTTSAASEALGAQAVTEHYYGAVLRVFNREASHFRYSEPLRSVIKLCLAKPPALNRVLSQSSSGNSDWDALTLRVVREAVDSLQQNEGPPSWEGCMNLPLEYRISRK